jgi:membrane protease YdiL (CAAX protease family)
LDVAAAAIAGALVYAIPRSLVHFLFPGLLPNELDWGYYTIMWALWSVPAAWFLLVWVKWRGAVDSHIPIFPVATSVPRTLLLTALCVILMFCLGMFLSYMFPAQMAEGKDVFIYVFNSPMAPFFLAATILVAPVYEEILYRGVLQSALQETRLGFWGASFFISSVWSLQHWYSWIDTVTVIVLGVVLSMLRRKTGSIFPGMLVHGFVNLWSGLWFAYFG